MLLFQVSLLHHDGPDIGQRFPRRLPNRPGDVWLRTLLPVVVRERLDAALEAGRVELHVEVGFAAGGYLGIALHRNNVSSILVLLFTWGEGD